MGSTRKDIGETDEAVAVDTSLVDEMLRLAPEERLRQYDRMLGTVRDLRDAFATRTLSLLGSSRLERTVS